jgi:hypothetical protein
MAGILYPEEQGVLAPATVNPLLLRQVQAQRAANPRPNVTDFMGYGNNWGEYGQNFVKNLSAQLPQEGEDSSQFINKMIGFLGLGGMAKVYHGSPHKFTKFDSKRIGTGEGAQAYGHGLYFADNPNVAKSYMGPDEVSYLTKSGAAYYPKTGHEQVALNLSHQFGSAEAALKKLREYQARGEANQFRPEIVAALEDLTKRGVAVKTIPNQLYKVDLPDDQIAKMLDWDAPLSKQPKALQDLVAKVKAEREALDSAKGYRSLKIEDIKWDQQGQPIASMTGGAIHEFLSSPRYGGSPEKTAAMLKELGIPGLKYFDQGSRAAGKGTSNYVVFDDQIPKIIGTE